MLDSVAAVVEAIQITLGKAERDNDSVYLESVPAFADLPPVQPALLVKAVPPGGLDASGERLFSGGWCRCRCLWVVPVGGATRLACGLLKLPVPLVPLMLLERQIAHVLELMQRCWAWVVRRLLRLPHSGLPAVCSTRPPGHLIMCLGTCGPCALALLSRHPAALLHHASAPCYLSVPVPPPLPPLPVPLGLVPDSSAKALSKYSDLVDSVARELLDGLAGATDAARLRLKEAELPDTLEALDAGSATAVPDSLLAELQEIQSIGGVNHLRALLQVQRGRRGGGAGGRRCCSAALAASAACRLVLPRGRPGLQARACADAACAAHKPPPLLAADVALSLCHGPPLSLRRLQTHGAQWRRSWAPARQRWRTRRGWMQRRAASGRRHGARRPRPAWPSTSGTRSAATGARWRR
jgi:hypothetical protein